MEYSDGLRSCQPLIRHWVDSARKRIARLLAPASCVLCRGPGADGRDLCAACERDLPRNDDACRRCAEPLARSASGAQICGMCLSRPPPFHASFVPFLYAYPLDWLVHGVKFRKELACGRVLGELFARRLLLREEPLPQVIVPVPLAPRRYRERGYNQACELALAIRRMTHVPVAADIVIRQRETAQQVGLPRPARRQNVRGAFATIAPLRARHIAILDDVITTGSTVSELAKVLLRAGAEHVEIWAIAKTRNEAPSQFSNKYSNAIPTNTAMPK